MALSNWGTLAIGKDGFIPDGTLYSSDKKSSVSLYKNWLYISDENMWSENGHFVEPIIAEIQSGEITISDFEIFGERSEFQNSIFVFILTHDKETYDRIWMAGIGSYGYNDRGDWVGIEYNTYIDFLNFLDGYITNNHEYDEDIQAWRKTLSDKPSFYNQGDAYFAENIGLETPISETPTKPIVMSIVENIK